MENDDKRFYNCFHDNCYYKGFGEINFRKHLNKVHKNNFKIEIKNNVDEKDIYFCHIGKCNAKFSEKQEYKIHVYEYHKKIS